MMPVIVPGAIIFIASVFPARSENATCKPRYSLQFVAISTAVVMVALVRAAECADFNECAFDSVGLVERSMAQVR